MNKKTSGPLARNSVFLWIAVATCLVLLFPLVAMQFTAEVNWGGLDFLLMGVLVFGASSLFVLVARRIPRRYRLATATLFVVAVLFIWAELAVGVFTNLGS